MHQLAGIITSSVKAGLELFTPPSFRLAHFPPKLRFLYLKSHKDQNKVTTIGYRYETSEKISYHVAKCRQDKGMRFFDKGDIVTIPPVKDIFSRKIGREIVTGRFNKYEPKEMTASSKEELYNKFIYLYHPERSERRKAKKALILGVLNEVKLESTQ